jgi:hypothetical protein
VPSLIPLSSQNDNASTPPQKGWSTGLEAWLRLPCRTSCCDSAGILLRNAGRPEIAPKAVLPLSMSGLQAAISIWQVTPPNQAPMLLFVPLAVVLAETAAEAQVIAAVWTLLPWRWSLPLRTRRLAFQARPRRGPLTRITCR